MNLCEEVLGQCYNAKMRILLIMEVLCTEEMRCKEEW